MSIQTLERIARINSRPQLAAFRRRVSAGYRSGLIGTDRYIEYSRFACHVGKRLTAEGR